MDINNLIPAFSQIPALGFILWLSHRLTTQTIPRIANEFREDLSKQRDDFKDALKQQREDFAEQLEREREFHQTQLDRLYRYKNGEE